MFPHPILASEDDSECIKRLILSLPELVETFFNYLEGIYIEGKEEALSTQVNLVFRTIIYQLQIIKRAPACSFRTDKYVFNSTEDLDGDLPVLLDRLAHLFLGGIITVGPEALLWKKACLRLTTECVDRAKNINLVFPRRFRLLRKMITFNSSLFFMNISFFCVSVVFSVACNIILPVIGPSQSVGVTIGVIAAVLLSFLSACLLYYFIVTSRSLVVVYNAFFESQLNSLSHPCRDKLQFQGLDPTSLEMNGPIHEGVTAAQRMKIERGRQTRKGYYTIPYGSDIGYVDGKQLDAQVVMIAYNEKFLITRWNNAAELMTGFLEEGCVGKPLTEVLQSPTGGNICEQLEKTPKGKVVKIKLLALATAPVVLFTTVSAISDPRGDKIGTILICANDKDKLRDYRSYMHNYYVTEVVDTLSRFTESSPISASGALCVTSLIRFVQQGFAGQLEELSREMMSDWEWTTAQQILVHAFGSQVQSYQVNVDPLFPPTLCLNPNVAKTIGLAVTSIKAQCHMSMEVACVSGNVFRLSFIVSHSEKVEAWNTTLLEELLRPSLNICSGNLICTSERFILRFPCQVAAILEDNTDASIQAGDQAQILTHARVVINCTVNVVTAIANMVDQHNLSLILLRTMFVSLASVRERADLEQRLLARPCDVDVVVCDSEWLSACRDLLLSGDHGAVIIPIVRPETQLSDDMKFSIRLPIGGTDVSSMMVEVGKTVSMKKNAITARQERERILTLRQDSPWTRGKLLGRGSYGAVYEATSDLTGGKMAVKMFYFSADREDTINQLLNEIKIMCSLNHPNIVHYFHCERKNNNVSLFMELCNCSLSDIIMDSKKKPPHLTSIQILRQVIAAITYLHSRGIIHRDIKPPNILLKGDTLKLTDFGTALQGGATKEVRGTFRYMAPEVYRGQPHSLPCDIWSIGCFVCELFACPPKFMNEPSLLGEMTSAIPYLENLPSNPVLRNFLERCFEIQPEQRPSSNDLLSHPILSLTSFSSDLERLPTIFDKAGNGKKKVSDESLFSISSADSCKE